MTLVSLLAIEAPARIEAIEELSAAVEGAAYAVRERLAGDDDADVRAAAAEWIGRAKAGVVAAALGDALYDSHPSVRAAACRGLARLRARAAVPVLRRLALEEPIWWVRRTAVLAVARIERREAIGLLREVLDDPFWRVRHAAVRALLILGEREEALAGAITAAIEGSDRARGALGYLARRLGGGVGGASAVNAVSVASANGAGAANAAGVANGMAEGAGLVSSGSLEAPGPSGLLADPDPAVIAARLEHGRRATQAELVEYLGDTHEALRRAAAARLRASPDVRALLVATLWLDEPRIPHAAAAVVGLLDGLGPEVDDLLDVVLAEPDARVGAAIWALSYVATAACWDRLDGVVAALAAAAAPVRRAAVGALAVWLGSRHLAAVEAEARAAVLSAVGAHLHDQDEDVRRLVVFALVQSGDEAAREAVLTLAFEAQPVLVKRLWVEAACGAGKGSRAAEGSAVGDVARLKQAAADADPETAARWTQAAADADPETAARALSALHAAGVLAPEQAGRARRSPDPWLRGALLDGACALELLAGDPDPSVRRAAFTTAARAGLALDAARIAANAEDPWLRTHAAERLARSEDNADLVRVLRLARDPDRAVRAAAADVTERARDFAARLAVVLAETHDDDVRAAAETWLGLRAERALAAALAAASEGAASLASPAFAPRVEAADAVEQATHIASSARARPAEPGHPTKQRLHVASPARAQQTNLPDSLDPTAHIASPRALGRSGLVLSPLVLSGAFEPSVASLFRALQAGCNTFFWEPRHRALTVFLREAAARGRMPLVVCGSYHATERALRADVEVALRRLGREQLDLFLVFWTRSAARLTGEVPRALERLKREGLVRATGFSTHDRALAASVVGEAPWDVLMLRHSAAHPGVEEHLLPRAREAGVGVLGFSASSYGRLLRPLPTPAPSSLAPSSLAPSAIAPPTAAECYRYSLTQPGLHACLSAPRGGRELVENLAVLATPTLDPARERELRQHGRAVRAESLDFGAQIRRFPALPDALPEALAGELADHHLDAELTLASDLPFS